MRVDDIHVGRKYTVALSKRAVEIDPMHGLSVTVEDILNTTQVIVKGDLETFRFQSKARLVIDEGLYSVHPRYIIEAVEDTAHRVYQMNAKLAVQKQWYDRADAWRKRFNAVGLPCQIPLGDDLRNKRLRLTIPEDRIERVLTLLEGSERMDDTTKETP